MKNYFIANGAILDTEMSAEKIESIVQSNLDESTGGLVRFRLQELSEASLTMVFVRDFLIAPNNPVIFDCDMNLILTIGIEAFLPEKVGGYPLVFPLRFAGKNLYTDVPAFIRFYKTLLLFYRKQEVEYVGIRCYSDRIVMKIEF